MEYKLDMSMMFAMHAISPADQEATLLTAYRAFNARDIDRALTVMTDDIDWPNGWEGGRVFGKDAVRAYWTRQWAEIDPHVKPIGFTALNHGRIRTTVRQTVRTLKGAVLAEGVVLHTYVFRGALIARMDISEPQTGAHRQIRDGPARPWPAKGPGGA